MSNETSQETWNATHAQLLKSVADAQAKLLAAQNETCDRLAVIEVHLQQFIQLRCRRVDSSGNRLSKRASKRRRKR